MKKILALVLAIALMATFASFNVGAATVDAVGTSYLTTGTLPASDSTVDKDARAAIAAAISNPINAEIMGGTVNGRSIIKMAGNEPWEGEFFISTKGTGIAGAVDKSSIVSAAVLEGGAYANITVVKEKDGDGANDYKLKFVFQTKKTATTKDQAFRWKLTIKTYVNGKYVTMESEENNGWSKVLLPNYAEVGAVGTNEFELTNGTVVLSEIASTLHGKKVILTGDNNNLVFTSYNKADAVNFDSSVAWNASGAKEMSGVDNSKVIAAIKFVSDKELNASSVKVELKVDADEDFYQKYGNNKNLYVYYVEETSGDDTVKGVKVTAVAESKKATDDVLSFPLYENTLGTYIVTNGALENIAAVDVDDATTEQVPNVNTGANDVVNVAIVMAVISLAAAAFVAVKGTK